MDEKLKDWVLFFKYDRIARLTLIDGEYLRSQIVTLKSKFAICVEKS